MSSYTQEGRPFRLETPLGPDVLLCADWQLTEGVSTLWELRVGVLSTRADVRAEELLFQPVTLTCEWPAGATPARRFEGIVRRVSRGAPGRDGTLTAYALDVVPQAWLLAQRAGYRVHRDEALDATLRATLEGLDLTLDLLGTYEPVPSRTRWRETPWAFANRLLERHGAWYAFRDSSAGTKLLVADSPNGAQTEHGVTTLDEAGADDASRLLSYGVALRTGLSSVAVATSHHALDATQSREERAIAAEGLGGGPSFFKVTDAGTSVLHVELYDGAVGAGRDDVDRSGGATASEVGKVATDLKAQAALHAQAAVAQRAALDGTTRAIGLTAGARVTVRVTEGASVSGDYFITQVSHAGSNGSYGGGDDASPGYDNRFVAIPYGVPFRPSRVTPWPELAGVHLATVVGPEGEEIHTDKHGRVRVVFDWEASGAAAAGWPAGDACWARVAQPLAGKGWGAFFLPRVGHRVLVSFLGGDPDAPYVVGSLYDATNVPLQSLPDEKTQTGLRTHSSPDGDQQTFNELRFDDKKGEELVQFKAQKDVRALVNANVTVDIVEGDQLVTHKKGKRTLSHEEGDDEHVMKKGARTVKLAEGDDALQLDKGNLDVQVKDGTWTQQVAKAIAIESRQDAIEVKAGKTITIKATEKIELVVGGSTITISSDKIEIKSGAGTHTVSAADVVSKAGASTVSVAQNGVEVKGIMVSAEGKAMTKIASNGMLQAKGSINMIG